MPTIPSRWSDANRINLPKGTSGSRASFALDSAYTPGVSGDALGIRWRGTNEPIDAIYLFADATTGNRANINLRGRIYDIAATYEQPGTTLRATASTVTYPESDDNWIKFEFASPYTPAWNELIFFVVDNNSASPEVDFPSILTSTTGDTSATGTYATQWYGYESTVGFSTNGLGKGELACLIECGSKAYGNPWTVSTSISSITGRRGILVGDKCRGLLLGMLSINANSTATAFEIFELSVPPTGVPFYSQAPIDAYHRARGHHDLEGLNTNTLPGTGPWVFCLNLTGSLSFTTIVRIEGYSLYSSAFDKYYDYFNICPVVRDIAGSWVVDHEYSGGGSIDIIGSAPTKVQLPNIRGGADQ
jgi:hypothetical protein